MKEVRDFAGFVLPFTAGIALASYLIPTDIRVLQSAALAALVLTSALLLILIHPSGNTQDDKILRIIIISIGACCGAFIALSRGITDMCSDEWQTWEAAARAGRGIGTSIDGIPFRHGHTNAIIKALIIGERSGIPHEISEAFRNSGASHILALSGFHLGIIYGILSAALSVIGNTERSKRLRSALTVAFCGFYTLATGAGASITRAFLFVVLKETARLTHRYTGTARILLSAMLVQLVFSPSSIKSASFQLSYAAMAGIALIYPRLRKLWPGDGKDDGIAIKGARWLWESAALSISCQLTTGPLAWLYFRSFPQHFLLTNLIALPLTSLLIPLSLLTLILHGTGHCPDPVIMITEYLVTALTRSLEVISSM